MDMDKIAMYLGYLSAGAMAARGIVAALKPIARMIPGDADDKALNAAERALDALDGILSHVAPGAFKRGAK